MYPLVIETDQLQEILEKKQGNILLVDLCKKERFLEAHIPGAIHLAPDETQASQPYAGYAPEPEKLTALTNKLGLNPDLHLIVYDDEGGGWAGRFIWLLDEIGHRAYSYVNGGFTAWQADGKPVESGTHTQREEQNTFAHKKNYQTSGEFTLSKNALLAKLGDEDLCIWDARSAAEYAGEKSPSKRLGHIPSAVNFDWLDIMDKENALRFRDLDLLRSELASLGILQNKTIVTHCQTHHRSGLTYLLAKVLGFKQVHAYAGSWGEWGNDSETPIEI